MRGLLLYPYRQTQIRFANPGLIDEHGVYQIEQDDLFGFRGIRFLNMNNLRHVPYIPWGVKEVSFIGCPNLESSPTLLDGIEEADFSGCRELRHLPRDFPRGLKRLNLFGCDNLDLSPENLAKLLALENEGCEIQFPDHFNVFDEAGEAKKRLVDLAARYKELNGIEAFDPVPSTTQLLHRILTENISQRGGRTEVMRVVNPVLDILEKDPNSLKWVEEISGLYLGGCVNQPVAGWSEISAFAAIMNAETMQEKIEASKHLFVNDRIRDFVRRTFDAPGVEVEAGNALLREVHKKAVAEEDIRKPWLGIPGPIAYEGTISGWLREGGCFTQSRVQEFYNEIKRPILHRDGAELADMLCEGNHCQTWGRIVFPEQVEEIAKRYDAERKESWDKIDAMDDADPDKSELAGGYQKYKTESEIKESEEIRNTVKSLTAKEGAPNSSRVVVREGRNLPGGGRRR